MLGDSMRRRRAGGRSGKRSSGSERGGAGRAVRLTGIAVGSVLAAFALGYGIATFVVFPPAEEAGDTVAVPGLAGESLDEARQQIEAAGLQPGEILEIPHPDRPRNSVLAQDPIPGQRLRPGASVAFAVSAGSPAVRVPDLIGFPESTARGVLERAGFEVEATEEEDDAPAGRVIAIQPSPGTAQNLPARVLLLISTGPPEPADTLPGEDTVDVGAPDVPIIPPRR